MQAKQEMNMSDCGEKLVLTEKRQERLTQAKLSSIGTISSALTKKYSHKIINFRYWITWLYNAINKI